MTLVKIIKQKSPNSVSQKEKLNLKIKKKSLEVTQWE